jgi:hypothetical protein
VNISLNWPAATTAAAAAAAAAGTAAESLLLQANACGLRKMLLKNGHMLQVSN